MDWFKAENEFFVSTYLLTRLGWVKHLSLRYSLLQLTPLIEQLDRFSRGFELPGSQWHT